MAIVCDTGAIYALYDSDDENHLEAVRIFRSEVGELFLPVVLLAEIDYLLTSRLGMDAALDFMRTVEAGVFSVQQLSLADLSKCRTLMEQYRDLPLGFSDSSVVVTAEKLGVQRLFTFDQRHFRVVQSTAFSHFQLLPADE
ncbi:MAG: PIN domain-containing protein [Pirellulaceae bacterium]